MFHVLKANGDKELFSEEKVITSITRAGIPPSLKDAVLNHVKSKLYDNIQTSEIYHHITEFLEHSSHPFTKARYSLKQAIMALGPTGYPFEDYISEILKHQGYETSVRNILRGECITHEVDIIAEKEKKRIMVEVKFHNFSGSKTNVHVALYTKARFDDVKEKNYLDAAWIVTNTKITEDAVVYAFCNNIKVISWSYPDGESLRDTIEKANLSPITAITTLSQSEKQQLLDEHIVLCRDLNDNPDLLHHIVLSETRRETILREMAFVCNL